jgi:UDPglucose 6-dehydrogenase
VGTAALLRERLWLGSPVGLRVRLVWNPEFLREGFAVTDTLAPSRLVYGVDGPFAEADITLLDEVYADALASGVPRLVTDLANAELIKVATDAMLAIRIAFLRAMAGVSEAAVADVVLLGGGPVGQ